MKVEKNIITTAPSVLVYKDTLEQACNKGTILFYHGLGASKDVQLHDLKNLAEYGFLVVGIDNVGHGERRYPDFEQKFTTEKHNFEKNFQQAVLETAQETPKIVAELREKNLLREDKLGITGISMGGFITYRAILEEPSCRVAVAILGSPVWNNNTTHSPHLSIEKFSPLPLLSLNAGKDQSVPPQYAREFHRDLEQYYSQNPEKICYIEYPEAEHFMPPNDWDDLWLKMVRWFERWI